MSERILVVVDAPMNAKYLEFALTRVGNFEVVKTENVDQILQLVKAQEVDLILMDISLGNSYYQGERIGGGKDFFWGDPKNNSSRTTLHIPN